VKTEDVGQRNKDVIIIITRRYIGYGRIVCLSVFRQVAAPAMGLNCACQFVSELTTVTYSVSSGTLNPTVPYSAMLGTATGARTLRSALLICLVLVSGVAMNE